MTVSSLAKMIIGVNDIVVENVDLETTAKGEQLVIRARPWKSSQKRCSVCGKECPGFDRGKGLRRWRTPDFGSGIKVFIEAEAPRVRCPEHGVVVQQVPWARHRSGFTKNFEDIAVWLSLHLSRQACAEYLRVSWDSVGPMITSSCGFLVHRAFGRCSQGRMEQSQGRTCRRAQGTAETRTR